MISFDLTPLVLYLNTWPAELVGVISFLCYSVIILGLFYYFGQIGLVVYVTIALIVANIEVLKAGLYFFSDHPMALGTLASSSTFFVIDMITEHYGPIAAKKAIWMSLFGCLMMTIMMILALGVKPLTLNMNSHHDHFNQAHQAMEKLFLPAPAILAASLISYLISLYADVAVYQTVKRLTKNRALWLRTNLSHLFAAFLDTFIFNILAWVILTPFVLSFQTVAMSYILGSFVFRILTSLACTPLIYISRILIISEKNK